MADAKDIALQAAAGALTVLLEQVDQMRGMFDDDDGAIERAVDDGEHAAAVIHAVLNGQPIPEQDIAAPPACIHCGNPCEHCNGFDWTGGPI